MVNKMNPEWKVLLTERGLVRENIPFSRQIGDLLNELQKEEQIPPIGRNDVSLDVEKGRSIGGFAATLPLVRHSERNAV